MNLKRIATIILCSLFITAVSCNTLDASAASESTTTVESVAKVASGSAIATKAKKKAYTKSELRLMASIINCEAGIEPYQGKIAVGIVVMNRVKSKAFPNTIKKVIYQSGQFSPVRNGALKKRLAQYDAGKIKNSQWKSCIKAAKAALNGQSYITVKGTKKNFKSFHFFSVYLKGARFRLGGHRFK